MITTEIERRAWRRALGRRLQAAGVDHPEREVGLILRALGGTPVLDPVSETLRVAADRVVARRETGMPLAYALGTAGFRYLELEVNEDVLIPRPETEGLVQVVLDWARERGGQLHGLEIGVGSGAIVLSLAREGTFASLLGTDVSLGALTVARRNLTREGGSWVRLMAGSFYAALRPTSRFDVIVSNPPYLTDGELPETDPSVHRFEPRGALVSSPDGLAHVRAICGGSRRHLAPGGLLALEIDARRAAESAAIARASGLVNVTVAPDVFGRDRILTAERE